MDRHRVGAAGRPGGKHFCRRGKNVIRKSFLEILLSTAEGGRVIFSKAVVSSRYRLVTKVGLYLFPVTATGLEGLGKNLHEFRNALADPVWCTGLS